MAFGDQVEFNLPLAPDLQFDVELPAFMGLGLVSGVVAVILMRSIFLADTVASGIQNHLTLPSWLRPAVAGVLLGLIATQFPVIIGVGYETSFAALSGNLILSQAILFCMIKVVAVSITMGGRLGGGVFSPLQRLLYLQCQGQFPFMPSRAWPRLPPLCWVRRFPPH